MCIVKGGTHMLAVEKINENKEPYLPLLKQSGKDAKYLKEKLANCDLYVLQSGSVCIAAVLMEVSGSVCNIIAIATEASHRKQGYAARLVEYITFDYAQKATQLQICLPKANAEPFYRLGFSAWKEENNHLYLTKDLKESD